MSALGHKPTCAVQNMMSPLHPKADMCGAGPGHRTVPNQQTKRGVNRRPLQPYGGTLLNETQRTSEGPTSEEQNRSVSSKIRLLHDRVFHRTLWNRPIGQLCAAV